MLEALKSDPSHLTYLRLHVLPSFIPEMTQERLGRRGLFLMFLAATTDSRRFRRGSEKFRNQWRNRKLSLNSTDLHQWRCYNVDFLDNLLIFQGRGSLGARCGWSWQIVFVVPRAALPLNVWDDGVPRYTRRAASMAIAFQCLWYFQTLKCVRAQKLLTSLITEFLR